MLSALLQQKEIQLRLVIQYQHKHKEKYQVIEEGLVRGLSKLADLLKKS